MIPDRSGGRDLGERGRSGAAPPVRHHDQEVELGIAQLDRRDGAQAATLRLWLHEKVLPAFAGRTLPIDTPIAVRCAHLHMPDPRSERDAWIAATGLVHGLTVVTRNIADFAGTGVRLLDPWRTGN